MFAFHIAFSLGLLSLMSGVFVYAFLSRLDGGCCRRFGKLLALIVVILSLASSICTVYCGAQLVKDGYPTLIQNILMQDKAIMDNGSSDKSKEKSEVKK